MDLNVFLVETVLRIANKELMSEPMRKKVKTLFAQAVWVVEYAQPHVHVEYLNWKMVLKKEGLIQIR